MYHLSFHAEVEVDVDDAYNWYEDQQPGLGDDFLEELGKCYKKLARNPHYYSNTDGSFRKILLKRFPYIIAFELLGSEVAIYAVFHTSRNPQEKLRRK